MATKERIHGKLDGYAQKEMHVESTSSVCYTLDDEGNPIQCQVVIDVDICKKGNTFVVTHKPVGNPKVNVKGRMISTAPAKGAPVGPTAAEVKAVVVPPPTIFAKGPKLFITGVSGENNSQVAVLTKQLLQELDSKKIRIDTRGMSRVQVASIMKAISERHAEA